MSFAKVDIEDNEAAAKMASITSVPTFKFFKVSVCVPSHHTVTFTSHRYFYPSQHPVHPLSVLIDCPRGIPGIIYQVLRMAYALFDSSVVTQLQYFNTRPRPCIANTALRIVASVRQNNAKSTGHVEQNICKPVKETRC